MTFDDPKAYTRPWGLSVHYDLIPDGDLIEYFCENERDKVHLVGKSGEEFRVSCRCRGVGAIPRYLHIN